LGGCAKLGGLVVEKTLAVTDGARREPRDLYDLWFILRERYLAHPEEVITGLNRKLASRDGRASDVLVTRLERVEAELRKGWETRLGVQVDMLPGFFRDVKQLGVSGIPLAARGSASMPISASETPSSGEQRGQ
jgi:hypothetical protein